MAQRQLHKDTHTEKLVSDAQESQPLISRDSSGPIERVETYRRLVLLWWWTCKRVLNNILINAIRYTPSTKSILVKVVKVNNYRIRINVRDEGPGISEENQKLIFEPYKRVSGDPTDGLGLGLAISKEFVEAMDGHIGVNSQKGHGAEFWIELRTAS